MPLQVAFSRHNSAPATLANGQKAVIKTGAGLFRPIEGDVGGAIRQLDAPTLAQHALKANDADVVHRTGDLAESVTGLKTFVAIPATPVAPTSNDHLVNKLFVDQANSALQTQINNLNTSVASAMKTAVPLDCSGNPNYPAASAGWQARVTEPGRVGGASGKVVQRGDTVVCFATSAGGTEAAVGETGTTPAYYVLQGNADQATEAVMGMVVIPSQVEALAGSDNLKAMTPLRTEQKIESAAVRFDKAQALTGPQKTQALANLGAEAAFSKGSLVQGAGVTLTGTLSNRLVGSGNVTIAADTASLDGRYVTTNPANPAKGAFVSAPDLDALENTASFWANSPGAGSPGGSAYIQSLTNSAGNTHAAQIALTPSDDSFRFRTKLSGVWKTWQQLVSTAYANANYLSINALNYVADEWTV